MKVKISNSWDVPYKFKIVSVEIVAYIAYAEIHYCLTTPSSPFFGYSNNVHVWKQNFKIHKVRVFKVK